MVLLGSVLLPLLSSAFPNDTVEGIMHLPPYCTCAEHGAGRSHKDVGAQNQISKSSRQFGDLGWRRQGVRCNTGFCSVVGLGKC